MRPFPRFLVERVGEAAPAHVARERFALCGVGRAAFPLDGDERFDGRDVAAQPPERGGELFGILICPIVERESQLAPFGRLCLGTAGGGLVARLPSACLGFLLAALRF